MKKISFFFVFFFLLLISNKLLLSNLAIFSFEKWIDKNITVKNFSISYQKNEILVNDIIIHDRQNLNENIFTAESLGYKKPHPKIFELAMHKVGANPKSSLMIGDSFEADIKGALAIKMQALHFNSHHEPIHDRCPIFYSLTDIYKIFILNILVACCCVFLVCSIIIKKVAMMCCFCATYLY